VTDLRHAPVRTASGPEATGTRPAPTRPPTSASPPRPAVTSDLAPPTRPVRMRIPGSLRISVWLWFAGFGAGLSALGVAVANFDGWHRELTDQARADQPDATVQLLRSGVDLTILLAVAGSGVLIAVSALCLVRALRPGPVARWLLTGAALLTLVVVLVDQGLVDRGADVARTGFLVQGGLVVLALLALFSRSSRTWFREHGD
jgi:hypothetical protein